LATRLLLERGERGGAQVIPPTLQHSLAARLDRLGPAREVAQIGAVLGRDFGYPLLRDVAELDEPALQASLDRLAEADLLLVEGTPPQANYRFKHALIQDAAYESLLKSRRQPLHRRAAELLRDDPERAAAEPEVIAHHFTEAGLDDLATEWWGKAGDQALRRSAFQEAIVHLGKAIAMADKAEGSTPGDAAASAPGSQRLLKLQTSYSQAVMYFKGYSAGETKAAFAGALKLAVGKADAAERFAAYTGIFNGSLVSGDLAPARQVAETFRREAESEARAPRLARACYCLGVTLLAQGDLAGARAQLEAALKIYDPDWDRETRLGAGPDVGAGARAFLAKASWLLGEVAEARELSEQAVARAIQSDHIPSRAVVYAYRALLETLRGDAKALLPIAEALVALSQEYGLAQYLAYGRMICGWGRARLGNREAGVREVRQGMAALADQGNKLYLPFFQARLAELESDIGEEGALTRVDDALALAGETGEHWSDSLLHRIRGEIRLKVDPANAAPAEEAFRDAIAVAQAQKARSFELQAALALEKLYQSTDRAADAHAVLAPALEGLSRRRRNCPRSKRRRR
jgi:tetratricopeptide (TPR) repeat protein